MSMVPNSSVAVVNIASRSVHSITSVFLKAARGVPWEYLSTSVYASGRRARLAKRTLAPFSSSNRANSRLIPVTVSQIAVVDSVPAVL